MKPEKYLSQHSEAEARSLSLSVSLSPSLSSSLSQHFDYALVLPCYDERPQDIQDLIRFCATNKALPVVVVNQPEQIEHCDNNVAMLRWIKRQHCEPLATHTSFCVADNSAILLIDRTNERIPRAQGVGLARKIGADCAHALITQGLIASPWIFCTDADATLPQDYFIAPQAHVGASAVIYPFEHIASGDENIDFATALYERRLHHYVAGLRQARSPYAFHSLGSTLAISAAHYAAAHGFPKRAGGEDFYLLNKLAKLAPVKSLQQPLLHLRSRASHRVPFGTGPAVSKLASCDNMLAQPLFYHPAGFELLGCWLDFFAVCADHMYAHHLGDDKSITHWRDWLAAHIDAQQAALLLQCIDSAEFETLLHKAQRQCRDAAALQRYLHTWFDGFRTLKLLHALRDAQFPLLSFQECFGDVPFDYAQGAGDYAQGAGDSAG